MHKLIVGLASAAVLVFTSHSVWALGVSLDVPVSYRVNDGGSADSVSGFKAGVSLPLFLPVGIGVGYEQYEAKSKDEGVESKIAFQIFDLFAEIPFPFINVTLGAGIGSHEVSIDAADYKKDGDVTQWFISLGYPIVPLIDVHVGYHNVTTEKLDATALGSTEKIDVSGEMWSLGVRVGF